MNSGGVLGVKNNRKTITDYTLTYGTFINDNHIRFNYQYFFKRNKKKHLQPLDTYSGIKIQQK